MGVFAKGLVFMLKDYSGWTSTHGVPHIGQANAHWLRLLWVLIVLGCVLAFLVQLKSLVAKYLQHPVNTGTNQEYVELSFPTVTICNINPWKKAPSQNSEYMSALMTAYADPNPNPNFGFTQGRTSARQQRAIRLTTLANQHLFEMSSATENGQSNLPDVAYTYDDLMIDCSFNAGDCNDTTDFTTTYDPYYGACVVYNADNTKTSSRAGPNYGLSLTLATQQSLYLPWTDSSGVVVAIHNSQDPAFPDVFGYAAPPGRGTSLGLSLVKTIELPEPYGPCTPSLNVSYPHYVGSYTTEACLRNCMQEEIIKACGCYYPGYPYLNETVDSCFISEFNNATYQNTSANLDCIDDITGNNASTGFNVLTDCNCPEPCTENSFSVTASTAQWPALNYQPTACTANNQVGMPWMANAGNAQQDTAACVTWYQKNTVVVEIYYEQISYQLLSETAAYSLISLVSDIGGQVGLFLGMSIISVFEFLTLILLMCFYVSSHRSRKRELEAIEAELAKAREQTEEMNRLEEAKEARRRAELRAQAEAMDDGEEEPEMPAKNEGEASPGEPNNKSMYSHDPNADVVPPAVTDGYSSFR